MMGHKTPKVVCAALTLLSELLQNFGPKKLDYLKPFFSTVEKLASSTAAPVRNDAITFYKEAYGWLGEAILKPYLQNLKKTQLDELEKYFAEVPKGNRKPLRSDSFYEKAPGRKSLVVSPGKKGPKIDLTDELDPYEIADPVDVFTRFNEAWAEKTFNTQKWNEKRDLLEEFSKQAGMHPKLANANNQHITNMAKKIFIIETNVNVLAATVKLVGTLAKGLRKNYFAHAKLLFPFVFDKYKEKKLVVIEETNKAMESLLYSIGIEDVMDHLDNAFKDKNAQLKLNAMLWISKYLKKFEKCPDKCKTAIKNVMPMVSKMFSNPVAEVRESSLRLLAEIKGIYGEEFVEDYLEGVNQNKLQKIEAMADKKGKKESKGKNTEKNEKNDKKNDKKNEDEKKNRSSTTKLIVSKKKEKINFSELPIEEIEKLIGQQFSFPKEITEGFDAKDIKSKLNVFQKVIASDFEKIIENFELFLFYLKAKFKEFKEPNIVFAKEFLTFLGNVAKHEKKPINSLCYSQISEFIVSKLGEIRNFELINQIFIGISDCIPPKTFCLELINKIDMKKISPKVIADLTTHLGNELKNVGNKHFPMKEIVDFFGKIALEPIASQAQTKGSLLNFWKLLFQYYGEEIVGNLTKEVAEPLAGEFEKISILSEKERYKIIEFKGEAKLLVEGIVEEKEEIIEESEKPKEKSFEKAPDKNKEKSFDKKTKEPEKKNKAKESKHETKKIEKKPKDKANEKEGKSSESGDLQKIIKSMGNINFDIRKNAFDTLENMFPDQIPSQGYFDLLSALKDRISDKNKQLQKNFINFLGRLVELMGKDIKPQSKQLLIALFSNLSDKQAAIRSEIIETLKVFMGVLGPEQILPMAATFLSTDNKDMKAELIKFFVEFSDLLEKCDPKHLIEPMLNFLVDKNKEVRENAEILLQKCFEVFGANPLKNKLRDLKPAVAQQIKLLFEKYGIIEDSSEPQPQSKKVQPAATTKTKKTGIIISKKQVIEKQPQMLNRDPPSLLLNNFVITADESLKELKEKRSIEEENNRWVSSEIEKGMLVRLQNSFSPLLIESVYNLMFSLDIESFSTAVTILCEACEQEGKTVVLLSDLIVKWLSFALWANKNQQLIEMYLELLQKMTSVMRIFECIFQDFEVEIICLFLKEYLSNAVEFFNDISFISNIFITQLKNLMTCCNNQILVNYWISELLTSDNILLKREIAKIFQEEFILNLCTPHLSSLSRIPELYKNYPSLITLENHFGRKTLLSNGFSSEFFETQSSPLLRPLNLLSRKSIGKSPMRPRVTRMASNSRLSLSFENKNFLIDEKLSQETFKHILNTLSNVDLVINNPDITVEAFWALTDLACSDYVDHIKVIQDNSFEVMQAMLSFLQCITTIQKRKLVKCGIVVWFFDLWDKILVLKMVTKALFKEEFLLIFTNLITMILNEQKYKTALENERNLKGSFEDNSTMESDKCAASESFEKNITQIIIRIMELSDPNEIVICLVNLMEKYNTNSTKREFGLTVKLLLKVAKNVKEIFKLLNLEKILVSFNQYIDSVGEDHNDLGCKMIKTFLNETVQIDAEKVLKKAYEVKLHVFFMSWIENIVKTFKNYCDYQKEEKNKENDKEISKELEFKVTKILNDIVGQKDDIPNKLNELYKILDEEKTFKIENIIKRYNNSILEEFVLNEISNRHLKNYFPSIYQEQENKTDKKIVAKKPMPHSNIIANINAIKNKYRKIAEKKMNFEDQINPKKGSENNYEFKIDDNWKENIQKQIIKNKNKIKFEENNNYSEDIDTNQFSPEFRKRIEDEYSSIKSPKNEIGSSLDQIEENQNEENLSPVKIRPDVNI